MLHGHASLRCVLAALVILLFMAMEALGSQNSSRGDVQMDVHIDTASGAFNLTLGSKLWLRGAPPVAGWPGAGSLRLVSAPTTMTGHDAVLGEFDETRFSWVAADNTRVQTVLKIFKDGASAKLTNYHKLFDFLCLYFIVSLSMYCIYPRVFECSDCSACHVTHNTMIRIQVSM